MKDVCRIGNPFEDDFVQSREIGDVCVAVIDEPVITVHQAEGAKQRLFELSDAHAGKLAISLAHADGSSMGLFAALVQVQRRCLRDGGRMILFNVPSKAADALESFNLLDHFTLTDDLEEALAAMHAPVPPRARASWFGQFFSFRRAAA